MKALQKLFSAKRLTIIQCIVCVAIIIAVALMSFGTIFTAEVNKNAASIEMFDKIVNSLGEGENAEMPDEIDISAPYIIKSVGSLGKIIKSATKAVKGAADLAGSASGIQDDANNIDGLDDVENMQDDLGDLEDKANKTKDDINDLGDSFKSEGFVSLVTLVVVIAQAFGQNFVLGLVYAALLGFSIALPVVAVIRALMVFVSLLKNLKDPGKAYSKICKSFGAIFAMFPTLWLFKILAPAVEFGANVTTMVALLIAGMAINLITSRLKSYTPAQFKYINVLQAVSLVSVIGYFIFMLNIEKSDIFGAIWDNIANIIKVDGVKAAAIVILLIIVDIALMFSVCKFIKKLALRLCCMVPTGKVLARDTYLVSAIFSLGLVAIPVYLMNSDFALKLSDDAYAAFTTFSAGIIIMFLCEIVMIILKKSVCRRATHDDIHAVLTGCPTGAELAETAPVTAEAPAEETKEEEVQ